VRSKEVDLSAYLNQARHAPGPAPEGSVHEVVGMLVEVVGVRAALGDELEARLDGRSLPLEVVGFRHGKLLTAPLGSTAGVLPGAPVRRRHAPLVPAGPELLGRVLDAFGQPLDGRPPPACAHRVPLLASPPSPFTRRPVDRPLETGVRVLDAMLALGVGQRVGLFAGTGVGKSTLLGMMCRRAKVDVTVVGLIGERGREVGDFVRESLGPEGLAQSVVIAATSDMPPLVRARGALRATAVAEFFRAQGKNVLLVMDSVTRYAMALRETTSATGEPPVTKGYTPSVFAALPALLERTGNDAGPGSITAVYTVLVEGDDLNDPIADAVRGILDGHVVLSRSLAERGLFPAVDVLKSVSRVMPAVCEAAHLRQAAAARELLGSYRDASDLIQIGAYVRGSDPRVDAAVAAMPALEGMIRQGLGEPSRREASLAQLAAVVSKSGR
jgi:FliI/YscN family ATPase